MFDSNSNLSMLAIFSVNMKLEYLSSYSEIIENLKISKDI